MYMAMNWKRNENWKIGSQFKEAIIITNAVCVMYFKTNYTLYLVLLHYYITLNAILWFFSNFISLAFRFKFDHRKKIASFDVIYWHQFNIREVVCIFQLFKSIFLFYIGTYYNKVACSNNSYVAHSMYQCKADVTKKFKIFDLKFVNPTPPLFHEQKKMQFKYKK